MDNNEIFAAGVKLGLKVAFWVSVVMFVINVCLFGVHLYYVKKSYESASNSVSAQIDGMFGDNANTMEVGNVKNND